MAKITTTAKAVLRILKDTRADKVTPRALFTDAAIQPLFDAGAIHQMFDAVHGARHVVRVVDAAKLSQFNA